jgi:isopropylmalate/homocitrate/citramalate synthase
MNEEGGEFSHNENELKELVKRFENMLEKGHREYFESEQFEDLVEHYIDENNIPKALKAIEIAGLHYPFSVFFSLRKA